jgi:hypothetical protein
MGAALALLRKPEEAPRLELRAASAREPPHPQGARRFEDARPLAPPSLATSPAITTGEALAAVLRRYRGEPEYNRDGGVGALTLDLGHDGRVRLVYRDKTGARVDGEDVAVDVVGSGHVLLTWLTPERGVAHLMRAASRDGHVLVTAHVPPLTVLLRGEELALAAAAVPGVPRHFTPVGHAGFDALACVFEPRPVVAARVASGDAAPGGAVQVRAAQPLAGRRGDMAAYVAALAHRAPRPMVVVHAGSGYFTWPRLAELDAGAALRAAVALPPVGACFSAQHNLLLVPSGGCLDVVARALSSVGPQGPQGPHPDGAPAP